MKILMEFPKPKDEEQAANAMPEVERKQVWVVERKQGCTAGQSAPWPLALLVTVWSINTKQQFAARAACFITFRAALASMCCSKQLLLQSAKEVPGVKV